jgi:hypothetical protein
VDADRCSSVPLPGGASRLQTPVAEDVREYLNWGRIITPSKHPNVVGILEEPGSNFVYKTVYPERVIS